MGRADKGDIKLKNQADPAVGTGEVFDSKAGPEYQDNDVFPRWKAIVVIAWLFLVFAVYVTKVVLPPHRFQKLLTFLSDVL